MTQLSIPFDPGHYLHQLCRQAATSLSDFNADYQPEVRPSDPRFGDFQANGVLPFAKRNRLSPRPLGEQLAQALRTLPEWNSSWIDVEVAGPGFLNFRFTPEFWLSWLQKYGSSQDLQQAAGTFAAGKSVVVDFSSPNTAKQMHVGHIRSTVIGDCLARLLAFCGARVIRDNHIGDWGTQFGKLIWAYKHHLDTQALEQDPLVELERLYKLGDVRSKEDPAILQTVRDELVQLQQGDATNLRLWQEITAVSEKAFQQIYDRLNIHFDYTLGESFYRDRVDQVYQELTEHKIAQTSEGALVVFHPEHPRFSEQPFLVRKSDGASNYASTDLATVLYRAEEWKADWIICVTDGRQRDHFEQLFLTAEKWFAATGRKLPVLTHVWFGTILGPDGKAIKTRSGEPVKLIDLIEEAEQRALRLVQQKSADMPAEEQQKVAHAVGVGALKYADLSQNRTQDYLFDWDKMISLEGNTAPYLQYAATRIRSIFRKLEIDPTQLPDLTPISAPETATELALVRKLGTFAPVLQQVLADLRPHYLCTYLYELAGEFSSFYNADKVLVEELDVRNRRLLLCARTLLVIETGLSLLGIPVLQRM
jgi:arginyl-tRNA synthetase